jgi:hypothetical protein
MIRSKGAGECGECELRAAAVVDPPLATVRQRAGSCVEEDHHEADRREQIRFCARVGDQQRRRQDEAAARADERADDPDGKAQ